MLNREFKYLSEFGKRRAYHAFYQNILKANPELRNPAEGEQEWIKRWRRYDKRLKPYAFRIFSRYIGADLDIAPLEVVQNIVEPVLTPIMMSEYYSDKNMVRKILSNELYDRCVPKVFIRNISGLYYDEDYHPLSLSEVESCLLDFETERVILKPSRLSSGQGVQVFKRERNVYTNNEGDVLATGYLKNKYDKDYLIQECVSQSDAMSTFNPTSVNTIRLATYRDKQGVIHLLHAGLRIGAKGADVDNAHAGGKFTGISESGKLGSCVFDAFGHRSTQFNGLDFNHTEYHIPCLSDVVSLAVEVATEIPHHDLIAFDFSLDKNNRPILIEFNTYGFGAWFFQFACGPVFGKFTEEIMSRCEAELKSYGGRIIVTSTI